MVNQISADFTVEREKSKLHLFLSQLKCVITIAGRFSENILRKSGINS